MAPTQNFYLRQSQQVNVKICQTEHYGGQRGTGTWVIEATEFKSEVRSDLGGHMEAAMASEASKMAVPGNIHIDARVIKVADVKFDLKGH